MKKTQVQAMMILRIAGVSIPPQLMRGPNDPGYREREPIRVSVSAARPGVKAWTADALHRQEPGYTLSVHREVKWGTPARSGHPIFLFAPCIGSNSRQTSAFHFCG